MTRAVLGIIGLFFFISGRMLVMFCRSITVQMIVLAIVLYSITGCAAVIDHTERRCYAEAYTVDAMVQCAEEYKPWHPGLTDAIAQPALTAERAYAERKRKRHMGLKSYTFTVDDKPVTVYATSESAARQVLTDLGVKPEHTQ